MAGTTVRVTDRRHSSLREMARANNLPLGQVLAQAVEAYRRQSVLDRANAAYAALRADPEAWEAELSERKAWDATLFDGLADQ